MSQTSHDAKAVVRAIDALTTQIKRLADAQQTPTDGMEGPLGRAIYDVILWTRKQWPPQRADDELWLNPADEGASVLIGGKVLGYQACASEEVPRGKALIYCKALGVYVGEGQTPDARFALMRLPL
ncbi:hypothetical protein [Streptomyces sp. XY006]|uniref:hypothetical protein n=1 Tax=Streptomyces sp. XY006 TaxID=2021410 RepID=UPI000B8BDBD0|nr:hypothetical protein [Streptomyces sp. XY006]OXS35407.1 hypothetical protein CHR28_10390 [Streptomyces sp. XY006]